MPVEAFSGYRYRCSLCGWTAETEKQRGGAVQTGLSHWSEMHPTQDGYRYRLEPELDGIIRGPLDLGRECGALTSDGGLCKRPVGHGRGHSR